MFGVLAVTEAFLPLLTQPHTDSDARGRIVNIGSISGLLAIPGSFPYSGTKYAVEAMSNPNNPDNSDNPNNLYTLLFKSLMNFL